MIPRGGLGLVDDAEPANQLIRIIHRAGEKPWPKLWHNLRRTRQTDLAVVIEAWPELSAAVRGRIVVIVKAAIG